jgi:hypothetical protein
MVIKYTKILHRKTLQNLPKLGFLGLKTNHLATLLRIGHTKMLHLFRRPASGLLGFGFVAVRAGAGSLPDVEDGVDELLPETQIEKPLPFVWEKIVWKKGLEKRLDWMTVLKTIVGCVTEFEAERSDL